jgi:hypothetical protein
VMAKAGVCVQLQLPSSPSETRGAAQKLQATALQTVASVR